MKYKIQKTEYKKEGNPNYKKGLPHCRLCGRELSAYTCKICMECIIKNKEPQHICLDCKKKISRNGIRCHSCHIKYLWRMKKFPSHKGIKNSNYKHGKTFNNRCIDCNKLLWNYRSTKCSSCAHKGNLSHLYGKPSNHGKRIKYKKIYFRSSWEVAYAKYLDKNKINWQYEPKTFDLGNATYTPDFYLSKLDTYIEVKGFWRDDAKKKFKLFKKQHPKIKIKILTKKDLIKLKIKI